jgi:membrane-bound metal-dependent hydrolase YbcI (DUF457 family)
LRFPIALSPFAHSILLALVVYLIFIWYFGKHRFREATAYGLAFASHCVLDFVTTKEGGGVQLLSPFSSERLVFGWQGLSEMPSKLSAAQIIQTLSIEFTLFAPPLFLILFLRIYLNSHSET